MTLSNTNERGPRHNSQKDPLAGLLSCDFKAAINKMASFMPLFYHFTLFNDRILQTFLKTQSIIIFNLGQTNSQVKLIQHAIPSKHDPKNEENLA